MENKTYRSPLFYVGDKYKLIGQIKSNFPAKIDKFIEPFVGGGSVFLNVKANEYLLNDIDSNLISIHKFLCENSDDPKKIHLSLFKIIDNYGLSNFRNTGQIDPALKVEFKKTYYARHNKDGFYRLRENYNNSEERSVADLYVLMIYAFNRMIRFNKFNKFNVPVGNVDFNKNVDTALREYLILAGERKITWHNENFTVFLNKISLSEDDFIYLDPPYLITFSEYNKLWNEETEIELLSLLKDLNKKNIKFAVSNVIHYKDRTNKTFLEWSKKFNVHEIKSNYISYHDNSIKSFSEVLVTNY